MSVYNGERHLREAVESILAQTYTDFEFVIVDDGSDDKTADILQSYRDSRMIVVHQPNMGLTRSLNRGVAMTRGQYIARQDADDVSLPDRLQKQVHFLDIHPEIALIGTSLLLIDEKDNLKGEAKALCGDIELKWNLLFRNAFAHSAVMIRKEALDCVGLYDERLEYLYVEDYELWSRIAIKYTVANLPEPLVKFRLSASSISERHKDEQFRGTCLVSGDNIARLLDSTVLTPEERARMQLFWYGKGTSLKPDELDLVVVNIQRLYEAFCRRYHVRGAAEECLRNKVCAQISCALLCLSCDHTYGQDYDLAARAFVKALRVDPSAVLRDLRTPRILLKLLIGPRATGRLRRFKSFYSERFQRV